MTATATTSIVGSLLSCIANGFAWCLERMKLKNTKEMQANAAAQTTQGIKDNAVQHVVTKPDIQQIEEGISE